MHAQICRTHLNKRSTCPAPDCVWFYKELHVRSPCKIRWHSPVTEAIRIDLSAMDTFFRFLYELKVYFNRAFHNIWQLKLGNICTVEVGNKPGVPWRDNTSGYREKQPARWTALGAEGIYYSLSDFPVITSWNGKRQKVKRSRGRCQPTGAPSCDLQGNRLSFRNPALTFQRQ